MGLALATDGLLRRADAGAVDKDPRLAVVAFGLIECRLNRGVIGNVYRDKMTADCLGLGFTEFCIEIEDRDLGTACGKHFCRRTTEAGGSAGHDRRCSLEFHVFSP